MHFDVSKKRLRDPLHRVKLSARISNETHDNNGCYEIAMIRKKINNILCVFVCEFLP